MYLPEELTKSKVLITVKTYPLPSNKYEELVCTAGIHESGKWIRIYPVPFRSKPYVEQYRKFDWVELDLVRNTSDFRVESYRPKHGIEEAIKVLDRVNTENNWQKRKQLVRNEVFTSMSDMITLAKGSEKRSLGTLKPIKIVDFVVEEDEREWKQEWRQQLEQLSLFERNNEGAGKQREVVRKLPYKYSYRFISQGDNQPRQLMIEDWEIGALYWNCLAKAEGNETEANKLVREKYFDEFTTKRDLYLFLGVLHP